MEFGVLFDMDGVLVDSGPIHREAWKILSKENGVEMDDEFFSRTFGMRNDQILKLLFGEGISKELIERLGHRKEEIYRDLARTHLKPARGAKSLVEMLYKRGVPMAVASSGPKKNVELMLSVTGLEDMIKEFVSAEDVSKGKPDPEVFFKAGKKINVSPEKCIVFEDAPVGIEAGKKAGMKVVGVVGTRPPQDLKSADVIVYSLEKISFDDLFYLVYPSLREEH